MSTTLRAALVAAFTTRLSSLGHDLSGAEISFLVDDAEMAIAADASAQADAQADQGSTPDPAQEDGTGD
jgi:hypothetical protein